MDSFFLRIETVVKKSAAAETEDLLNLLDYSLVIASWLDVATSASTYRERVTCNWTALPGKKTAPFWVGKLRQNLFI